MTAEQQAASTVPAPPDLPQQCPCCGAVLLAEEMRWRPWGDLGLEVAECRCGTTISREARS